MTNINMQTEEWRFNPEFNRYMISSLGRIRSIKSGRLIKTSPNVKVGYMQVKIYDSAGRSQTLFLHRLVYHTFHGVWSSLDTPIDHINDNKLDNSLSNLRLVTARENIAKRHLSTRDLPTGVRKTDSGKYYARICGKGIGQVHLGTYDTPEEAHQAYLDAAARIDNPNNSQIF